MVQDDRNCRRAQAGGALHQPRPPRFISMIASLQQIGYARFVDSFIGVSLSKAFNEDQRIQARQTILKEGRRLFIDGGLGAISLSRLCEAAGIAKTSFYAFFPSKEDLLLELLAGEAPGFSARVMAPLGDPKLPAREALSEFLHALFAEYQSNLFLARLVAEPQTLAAIARRVRAEDLKRKTTWMERPLAAFLTARIAAGDIAPQPVEILMDVIRSVSLLSLHRDRFGNDERFEAATSTLIALVTDGLITQEPGS